MGTAGAAAAPAVPILCEKLEDKEPAVRQTAAAALARIGEHAAPGVASLIKALSDADPVVRRNAALAFCHIGPKAGEAAKALARIVASKEEVEEVRLFAAEALAKISPEVEPAVPVLLRVVKQDGNWMVRQRAVWALARLPDPQKAGALPILTAILDETEQETRLVRYDSAIVLGVLLGPKSPDKVVDVLEALLKDKQIQLYNGTDARVRSAGTEGAGGQATVTRNIQGDIRGLVAVSLGRIGKKANRPDIIRILKEAAQSDDPAVRKAAAEALSKIN
jgi:HEAT repeat protein